MPFIAIISFICLVQLSIPNWTRDDSKFGVMVPKEFLSTGSGIRTLRRYRLEIVGTGAAMLVLFGLGDRNTSAWALPLICFQILGGLLALLQARWATVKYGHELGAISEENLASYIGSLPGNAIIAAGPLVILFGTAIYAAVDWPSLPKAVFVRWAISGSHWMARTTPNVTHFFLEEAATCGLLSLCAYGIQHWSRRMSARGKHLRKIRRFG